MSRISIICDDFDDFNEDTLQGIEAVMADMPLCRVDGSVGSAATKDKKNKKNGTHIKWIDIEKVKPQINENILSIVSLVDEKLLANNDYEISELEFSLSIKGETNVSVLPVISAGLSAHSGITVKIRKKSSNKNNC